MLTARPVVKRAACRADCTRAAPRLASAQLRDIGCHLVPILFDLAFTLLNLLKWAVILVCIFSLLTSFGVLDTRNRMVWTIGDFLYRVTEPVLGPVRRIMPTFGAVDLSPFVVVILIQIVAIPLLARLEEAIMIGSFRPVLL